MSSRTLRSRIEAGLFDGTLSFVARLARGPGRGLVDPLLSFAAALVRRYRRSHASELGPAALGKEWQRLMPNPKVMAITRVDGETAYGEIRVRCPLRGTGDVQACHRLMGYDRALMRPAGGRFVVLQSQAQAGVEVCQIAIRPSHLPADDLVPAHQRHDRTASTQP